MGYLGIPLAVFILVPFFIIWSHLREQTLTLKRIEKLLKKQ